MDVSDTCEKNDILPRKMHYNREYVAVTILYARLLLVKGLHVLLICRSIDNSIALILHHPLAEHDGSYSCIRHSV